MGNGVQSETVGILEWGEDGEWGKRYGVQGKRVKKHHRWRSLGKL